MNEVQSYSRDEALVFLRAKAAFGGFSNMAFGYPLIVNGVSILASEALYQACRFPHLPELQRRIISQTDPISAKRVATSHRGDSRSDWEAVKVEIMRWCLRLKLLQNYDAFSHLLIESGERAIVVHGGDKPSHWSAGVVLSAAG